jgi:phospholipase A1
MTAVALRAIVLLAALPAAAVAAQEPEPEPEPEQLIAETCLLRELKLAGDEVTVGALREKCAAEAQVAEDSLLLEKLRRERAAEGIRSLLTPHKRNYLIPASYMDEPNEDPFETVAGVPPADRLDRVEAKFQLSIKFSLAETLLTRRDRVYFGFSALAFWQAYNRNVSAPFRETDYEPELFWTTPLDWGPLALDAGILTLGVSHQSNGRGGDLSRSWNRIYGELQFEKDNLVVGLKPWWRIPEDEKDDPLDARGDDNPDIEKYLGHFEFTTVYRRGDHEWSLMLRNNFGSGKGAARLEWAFPLWRGVRGYAQYFNGYGESLIDYDAHMERFGVGILLTDLL